MSSQKNRSNLYALIGLLAILDVGLRLYLSFPIFSLILAFPFQLFGRDAYLLALGLVANVIGLVGVGFLLASWSARKPNMASGKGRGLK